MKTQKNKLSKVDLIKQSKDKLDQLKILYDKQSEMLNREDRLWSYVYLIKCNEFCKIGHTFNLDNRLNSLQTGNPYNLEITFSLKHPKAEEVEFYLQEKFLEKKVLREWFKLSDDDIVDIKRMIENYEKK